MKQLPAYTWNQWLAACKEAWATEGQKESFVHNYLLACNKTAKMTLVQIAASAYAMYKYDRTGNAQ